MNSIKNIAVLVSCIDEEYQNKIINGIQDYAEDEYSISIFTCFGGNLKSVNQDIGEYNIFNLINYELFDGVILLTNTITSEDAKADILKRLRNTNVCTISIDYNILDTYNISIDNYDAMTKIVNHLIEVHGFTRINYVSGSKDNSESVTRFQAYKDTLKKHNIPYENERVYFGHFRSEDGERAVKKFLDSKLVQPQAIVCANDVMAIATIRTLQNLGYQIPNDVAVTGFDRIYDAKNYSPEITTIDRPLYEIGQLACEKIENHILHRPQKLCQTIKTRPVFTQSCGCSSTRKENIKEFKVKTYSKIAVYHQGILEMNTMASNLAESNSMSDIVEKLKPYIKNIKCDEFYLCLCNDLSSFYSPESGFVDNIITTGYTKTMTLSLRYKDGKFSTPNIRFNSEDILPNFWQLADSGNNVTYYVPIHFHEKCLGYCAIVNSEFPMNSPLFHTWIVNVSTAIENIRNKTTLKDVVNELDRLYVIDNLSNIYNRNGFYRFAGELYKQAYIHKDDVVVLFIDLDGLKYINDNFGHKEGDNAIIQVANSLKNACVNNEVYARFGGDEFLVFAVNYTDDDAKRLCASIKEQFEKYNTHSDKPYRIGASIGYHITSADENIPILNIVNVADSKMYELKKQSRALRESGQISIEKRTS